MKNLLMPVAAFLLTLAHSTQAQTTKGSFMLSLHNFSPIVESTNVLAPTNALGFSFGSTKTDIDGIDQLEFSYSTLGLSASGHYFLIDNLAAGINLNVVYQHLKNKQAGGGDNDEFNSTLFMAGPELRYYFPLSSNTKVWVNGKGAWGTVKASIEGLTDDNDPGKLSQFGGGAGLSFFPFERFSIDLGLGYSVFTVKEIATELFGDEPIDRKETTSGVTLDVGFSLFF